MEVAYLTDRIVALWFPDTGSNSVHASDLARAARTLEARHGDDYMVFNLSERKNDLTRLGPKVLEFGWPPGLAPPLQRLCAVCKAVDAWILSDPKSVAVLHSKGDKGRIGTAVWAYLRYTAICSPNDAVSACERFFRDKLLPDMQPSQKRYVRYFAGLLSGSVRINSDSVFLHRIVVHGVPDFEPGGGFRPFFKIYRGMRRVCTTSTFFVSGSARRATVDLEPGLRLHGDALVECYHDGPAGRSPVFRIQFHTCAVDGDGLLFPKEELDEARDDFRFPSDGKVELRFCPDPDGADPSGYRVAPSEDGRHPLSGWDSYENFDDSSESECSPPRRFPGGRPFGPILPPDWTPAKKESQLDRMLDDMIRQIHSVAAPGHAPDRGTPPPPSGGGTPTAVVSVNGNRRVLSPAADEEDRPYHARKNCAPFTYGVAPGSPVLQRKFLRPVSPVDVREDPAREARLEDPDSRDWLRKQQEKLKARKEGRDWEDRQQREQQLMAELRSAHGGKSPEVGRPDLFSPQAGVPPADFSTPLHVNVYEGRPCTPPPSSLTAAKPPICRGSSAPSSPLLPSRGSSREATRNRYQQWQSSPPPRNKSEERERPSAKKGQQPPARPRSPQHQTTALDFDGGWRPAPSSPTSVQLDQLELSLQALASEPGPLQSTPLKSDPPAEMVSWSPSSVGGVTPPASPPAADRPATPSFPVRPATPYFEHESSGRAPRSPSAARKDGSPSPAVQALHQSLPDVSLAEGRASPLGRHQRSSLLSLNEPSEVIRHHPLFVKDTSRFWYKPDVSREEAIAMLKDKPPGTFVVRDSNSFPGAFGLALKVATPPPNVQNSAGDASNELVRHFLIEPTSKGVRLKGCANEPVFGSLSALVYQHSLTPLALPRQLILPDSDPAADWRSADGGESPSLSDRGAACSLLYLGWAEVESLTGSTAVDRALTRVLESPGPADAIHFKVSGSGITLTDHRRRRFFRRHYPLAGISYCGLDPKNRRWTPADGEGDASGPCFGFVAKKAGNKTDNQCHLLAQLDEEQPASAVVNFVRRMAGSAKSDAV